MVLGRTGTPDGRRKVTLWDDVGVSGSASPRAAGPDGGLTFPPDAFGGGADRAWLRWTTRGGEATTLQLGSSNDGDDHIALMPGMERPDGNGRCLANVGIGTLSPQWKLEVKGPVAGNAFYFTETAHIHSGVGNVAGRAAIENARDYNTLMVLGRARPENGGRRHVTLYDDVVVSGVFYNQSDARLKHDVQDCPHGLDAVLGLRPVAFRWNGQDDGRRTLGLIAQEVQGVVDEVVDDSGEHLAVSYTGLVPVLVRAVQELERRVAALQPVPAGGARG